MKNQLYEVIYTDKTGQKHQRLFVSNERKYPEDARKLISEENIDETFLILKHSLVSGFHIQPISQPLENIVEELEQYALENYHDADARIGYLEALRDVLSKANEDWKQQDLKRHARSLERLTGALGGDSNVPGGYDNEGNRR